MRHLRPKSFVLFLFSIAIILACQEDEGLAPENIVDEDLEAAMGLADEYLISTNGRGYYKRSITIFRYKEDEVYFNTNTDDINGYQLLTEESITAIVDYGEYVFWYSGGGMTDLDGIEFDQESEEFLQDFPEEINYDKMWVIQMPEKGDLGVEDKILLKYDILYQYRGYEGAPIRLDPKIKLRQGESGDDNEE